MKARPKRQKKIGPPKVSLVVPVWNEEFVIEEFHRRAVSAMEKAAIAYEIVFVDDGSSDRSADIIDHLSKADGRTRGLIFSRHFGKEAALSAGLREAVGAWVVPIDADLQDPPELVPAMLAEAERSGMDMVFARRRSRIGESFLRRRLARSFYYLLRWCTGMDVVPDTGDFRVMRRAVVDAVNHLPENARFMKGLFRWVGFRQKEFPYDQAPRFRGKSKWPYAELFEFAIEAVTGSSSQPLRMFRTMSWILGTSCLAGAVIGIPAALLLGAARGTGFWLSAVGLFLGAFHLFGLGLFAEYLRRIFEEVKNRPIYVVARRIPELAP